MDCCLCSIRSLVHARNRTTTKGPLGLLRKQKDMLSKQKPAGAMKPTILVADDELGVRTALRLLLQPDYDLFLAEDGLQAVEHVKDRSPDLILMDVRMPRMDGWQAIREIRNHGCWAPVIVITGYADPSDEEKAKALKVSECVSKPFDLFALKEIVARVVNGVQAGSAISDRSIPPKA